MERGRDFADIVYTLLVTDKLKRIEDVADAMGISYASLHARLINRTCFSADEIRAVIKEVPDHRLVDYLLEESGFIAIVRHPEPTDDEEPAVAASRNMVQVQRGASRIVIDATDVLEIVDAGLAGGRIDHRVARLALRALVATERAVASLRVALIHWK